MTPDEFSKEFVFDPTAPRAMGYVTNLAAAHDGGAIAVTATALLLDRDTKRPTDKWIGLQMLPHDALALAASILALAKDAGWQIPDNVLELVVRVSMKKTVKH